MNNHLQNSVDDTAKQIVLLKAQLAVMEAHLEGKPIEYLERSGGNWMPAPFPRWNWRQYNYRTKPPVPASIDWSHVNQKYQWLAIDNDGQGYLYEDTPERNIASWSAGIGNHTIGAEYFASYNRGDIVWSESLIERPVAYKVI